MSMQLTNKKIISLDSISPELNLINTVLLDQQLKMIEQLQNSKKIMNQLKIANMYKSHENDFVIDDNIFENDDI